MNVSKNYVGVTNNFNFIKSVNKLYGLVTEVENPAEPANNNNQAANNNPTANNYNPAQANAEKPANEESGTATLAVISVAVGFLLL